MENKKFRNLNESARRVMSGEKEEQQPLCEEHKELIEKMMVLEQEKQDPRDNFDWRDLFRPGPVNPDGTPNPFWRPEMQPAPEEDIPPVEVIPAPPGEYEPTDDEIQRGIRDGLRNDDGTLKEPVMASNNKMQAYLKYIKDQAEKK